ncbi:MAG: gephyrin-like molybdotransferase Glp [Spirulinaceae cyanobacterium]
MLPVKEAEAIVLELSQPLDPQQDFEIVGLEEARGRILAEPVTSKLDFPHWDNSAMDGYGVRFADVQNCGPEKPVSLEIVEEIPAGYQPQVQVQPGQAARIFTGAVMPEGADTVVMQENTQSEGNVVQILTPPQSGEFVRRRGDFYQAEKPLLNRGTLLNAPEIAVLAAAQCNQFKVYRRLRVAIFATGDELISPVENLQPGQIVDSNQYALTAFVAKNGCTPVPMGIVKDKPELLKEAIAFAIASADVVLSTGGVSVGDYDLVDQILQELGGKIHLRKVRIKPGKPLTVATFNAEKPGKSALYFGIPGNPVSALVSCWRFVQPALRKMSGLKDWQPTFIKARTQNKLRAGGQRETYLWGTMKVVNGAWEFSLAPGTHNSANLVNLAGTTALAVVPVGRKTVEVGEEVEVMLT